MASVASEGGGGNSGSSNNHIDIFGFTSHAKIMKATFGFLIIVVFIVGLEHMLKIVDEKVEKTAWKQTIESLYKELVIMGLSSFMLTLLVASNSNAASAMDSWIVYLVSALHCNIGLT